MEKNVLYLLLVISLAFYVLFGITFLSLFYSNKKSKMSSNNSVYTPILSPELRNCISAILLVTYQVLIVNHL